MDRYLQERIENITEEDFWSSIRPAQDTAEAVEAGKAGRKAAAYGKLIRFHRESLDAEADAFRVEAERSHSDAADRRELRREADRLLRHEIRGWHAQTIHFGDRIDFNADFGRAGQYGFHYLVWLRPLLEQVALTDEDRDRRGLLDILMQYYRQRGRLRWRIPGLHPVYYELGAYTKTALILPAYALLSGRGRLTASQAEALLKLLLGFARSLYRLERTYRPGNWQLAGSRTLYWLGCAFGEFRAAGRWRRRAMDRLRAHCRRGFHADGGHIERCWGYGWMSLSAVLTAYRVGMRHGRLAGADKAALTRALKRGFRWFATTVSPTGHMLNYGDGQIRDAEEVFEEARRTFPRMDRGKGLLGVDRSASCILRPSGYAFLRCGGDREAPFMSVNFGPSGGGHTHADLLDFSMWCFGEPLIEEVGRFGSYDHPLNPLFRAPEGHNQVVIEHVPMNRSGFRGEDVTWGVTDRADFFSAFHRAYHAGGDRARMRRSIVFVKPGGGSDGPAYWVVHDRLVAVDYPFQVSSLLHARRPFEILDLGVACLSERGRERANCLVRFAAPPELRRFSAAPDYVPADTTGLDSSKYEFADQRHRLTASKWRDVGDRRPIEFAMLLLPFRGKAVPDAAIRPAGTGFYRVAFEGRTDLLCFNPDRATLRSGSRRICEPMAARVGRKWFVCPSAPGTA